MKELFKSLADDLGLDFSRKIFPRKYMAGGNYRGHNISINSKNRKKRWNDIEFIQIHANLKNPTDTDFALFEQTAISKVGIDADRLDAEVGNPKFDKKFLIRCIDKKDTKKILSKEIQEKILKFHDFNVQIDGRKAFMEYSSNFNKERMKLKVDILIDILDNIDSLK